MDNINNREIMSILDEANGWVTFEEIADGISGDHDYIALSLRLENLAKQGMIQYVPASGMERSWYGRIGLVKE